MNALKTVIVSTILWLAFPAMCAVASFIVYGGGWLVYRLVTMGGLHIIPGAFIVLMVSLYLRDSYRDGRTPLRGVAMANKTNLAAHLI